MFPAQEKSLEINILLEQHKKELQNEKEANKITSILCTAEPLTELNSMKV